MKQWIFTHWIIMIIHLLNWVGEGKQWRLPKIYSTQNILGNCSPDVYIYMNV